MNQRLEEICKLFLRYFVILEDFVWVNPTHRDESAQSESTREHGMDGTFQSDIGTSY